MYIFFFGIYSKVFLSTYIRHEKLIIYVLYYYAKFPKSKALKQRLMSQEYDVYVKKGLRILVYPTI